MRKENWSAKMMRLATAEDEVLSLAQDRMKDKKLWSTLEKEIDSKIYNNQEEKEIANLVKMEEASRSERINNIDQIENSLHHAIGRTFFAKQVREKRRKLKRSAFKSNFGGRQVLFGKDQISIQQARFVEFEIRGRDMLNMDKKGKSDPYLSFKRLKPGVTMVKGVKIKKKDMEEVYRTDIKMNTLKPHWNRFTISAQALCKNSGDEPIIIQVMDWDLYPPDDYIGEVRTDLNELMNLGGTEEWINMHRPGRGGGGGGADIYAGCLKIQEAMLLKESTMKFEGEGKVNFLTKDEEEKLKDKVTGHAADNIRKSFEQLKEKIERSNEAVARNAGRLGLGVEGGGDGGYSSGGGSSGSYYSDSESDYYSDEGMRGKRMKGELTW